MANFGTNEEFIEKYRELKSSRKMGEYYHCGKNLVLKHAKDIGYDVNENKTYKLSAKDKEEIIKAYNSVSSVELAKKYNVSRGMITKIWYDNNLKGKQVDNHTTQIDMIGQKFGKWTVIGTSEKRNAGGCVYWLCRCECGVEKEVLGTSLRSGRSISCGNHSNISKGNVKISQILDEANINYQLEKKFETCKDIKELPFDFYVNNQYCIEYDGEQHYKEDSLFDYDYTHKHDIIKSNWCKENNIPLIRIPYTHYNNLNLEDLLLETSKFVEK